MIATWVGAVSNDWNDDDNWKPTAVPGAGETILDPANPTSGRQPKILDGANVIVYDNIGNDEVVTLASSCDQTNVIIIGPLAPSGAGASRLTDSVANPIHLGAIGPIVDNQEPMTGGPGIFGYAAPSLQIFDPTGAS
jgi:hypothetical protein